MIPLLLTDGTWRRTWTTRDGHRKSRVMVVRGDAVLELAAARWRPLAWFAGLPGTWVRIDGDDCGGEGEAL